MSKEVLWTKPFWAILIANGLLFVSFHCLLPTLPLYIASLGSSAAEIGLISGSFGVSAIFIRFFTDDFERQLGKKKCLYLGIGLSIVATVAYLSFTSFHLLLLARLIQGLGFGLGTTFAAALAVEIIPAGRRGEGVGFFGLGSTVSMGIAPALGVLLLTDNGAMALFAFAGTACLLALGGTFCCKTEPAVQAAETIDKPKEKIPFLSHFFEQGTGLPAFLTMLFGFSYGSVNTFVGLLAEEVQVAGAGLFFVVGTVFVFISRTFGGRLFDRFGALWVVLPGVISYLTAVLLLINVHSEFMLLTASVFYGLGAGLIMPSLMTWLFNCVAPSRRSNASATYYNMLDLGTSGGIMALGAAAGMLGYVKMFYFVVAAMLLFLLVLLGASYAAKKQQERKRKQIGGEAFADR